MVLAVLWVLGSLWNIYQGLNGIIIDLGALPYLSDPRTPEWFRFGIPAEIMLGFFVLAFGFLTLLVVYGLYTAKSWSYDFALGIPIFIFVLNIATMGLYASAPAELELREGVVAVIPFLVGNIVLLVCVWSYLPRPHVKQYLNKIPAPSTTPVPVTSSVLPVPSPPEPVAPPEENKFCRYCGAQNHDDAVFCEKCGKKIE